MVTAINLGTGILTWSMAERRSDRYGSVFLMSDGDDSYASEVTHTIDVDAVAACVGKAGKLVAIVVDPRESTHVGDLMRGIMPSVQAAGAEVMLGEGVAFGEEQEGCDTVIGLKPAVARNSDWLDPEQLYRVHEHLVRLLFVPGKLSNFSRTPEEPRNAGMMMVLDEDKQGGFYQVKES